jgi:hypothetical protein
VACEDVSAERYGLLPSEPARRVASPKQRAISRKKQLGRYGLSPEQFARMMQQQNGRCAVCGTVMLPPGSEPTSTVVDHDHVSGKVRGLLHQNCNKVIGFARDNTGVLRAAIRYLENHADDDR